MTTKLHFSRFEFKYVLLPEVRRNLEAELLYFLELDPYVERQVGQKYHVRSLYFDNRAMSCYYDNLDGVMHRAKFRLRTYCEVEDETTPCFLEIKGRHNALVFKHRAELTKHSPKPSQAKPSFASDSGVFRDIVNRLEEGEMRSRFVRDSYRKTLEPVMLIDYQRRPYISKYDPEFRLTFDDTLSCCATSSLFPGRTETHRHFLRECTILEIKFRHHVPRWFHRIIQAFELRRVSISKYCAGVEAYDLVPKLE